MDAMLKVEGINVYYGAIHAIKDVSFQVNEGEVVTLIGANGHLPYRLHRVPGPAPGGHPGP